MGREEESSESAEEEKGGRKKDKKEKRDKTHNELDELMSGERFKDLKMHKNQLTIKPRTKEWTYWYRRQESERYANPTRPWIYYNEDSSTSIVAPVSKKPIANVSSDACEFHWSRTRSHASTSC